MEMASINESSTNGVIASADDDDDEEVSSGWNQGSSGVPHEYILHQLRMLIRENVLPRLGNLEEEIRLLRKVTWPVCQGVTESGQLGDIKSKREFLRDLDPEEIRMLLRRKTRGSTLIDEEFDLIMAEQRLKNTGN